MTASDGIASTNAVTTSVVVSGELVLLLVKIISLWSMAITVQNGVLMVNSIVLKPVPLILIVAQMRPVRILQEEQMFDSVSLFQTTHSRPHLLCTTDSQCEDGLCVNGHCESVCGGELDCGSSESCHAVGYYAYGELHASWWTTFKSSRYWSILSRQWNLLGRQLRNRAL